MASYMAANCAAAMDPLYQASLNQPDVKDRALLYLAHCQSLFARDQDAAFNIDQVKKKNLKKEDEKLYKELTAKLKPNVESLHKIYYNVTPYVGQGSSTPNTVKAASSFYGFSLGISRPTWSVGAFYEGFTQKLTSKTAKTYTQTMMGGQGGYFILPSWRLSGSYASIHGSNTQLNSVSAAGLQTDYYISPTISVSLEYYSSNYATLMADKSGTYKYPVSASQFVAGVGFPIYNSATFGVNGTASYTGITLRKSTDKAAVSNENLDKNPSRIEVAVSSYFSKATAGLTYWTGQEILGVRSRGTVIMGSTDLRKGGSKVNLGYAITPNVSIGASYSAETYRSTNVAGTYEDFQSATSTGVLILNW
jgi:hypothetical protein